MSKPIDEYKIVSCPAASIYSSPSFKSEIINQALIWEKLIICDKKNNWYKIKQRDGYIGWIHSFYTVDASIYDKNHLLKDHTNWYWVKDKFITLLLDDNSKFLISFGSLIPCFNNKDYFFTLLPNNEKVRINKESLIKFTDSLNCLENLAHCSKQLLGTPYLWGGRSSFGFDCSGLVQSLFNVCYTNASNYSLDILPRDTSQQILSGNLKEITNGPNIGDIIFFQTSNKVDHVGLYINTIDFIHSSGFVKRNSINKQSQYYSNKLDVNLSGIYRIKISC